MSIESTSMYKEEKYRRFALTDFSRLNSIAIESGLISRLHELFRLQEKGVHYLVFDAVEVTRGSLLPTRTRYIFPMLNSQNELHCRMYPGLVFSETLYSDGARNVNIKIGLQADEEEKINRRLDAIRRSEYTSMYNHRQPTWWSYHFPSTDMTRDYDLGGLKYGPRAILQPGELLAYTSEVYIWTPDEAHDIPYEESYNLEQKMFYLWDNYQDRVQSHMSLLQETIRKMTT